MFSRRLLVVQERSTTLLQSMRIMRKMSGNSSRNSGMYENENENIDEDEMGEDFGERRARLAQLALDRKQRAADRNAAANLEQDGGSGGTLPSEFVSPLDLNVFRDRLGAQLKKLTAYEDRYSKVRAQLALLRERSYAKRTVEFRQRRERRAKHNIPRMTKSEQLARRDSSLVLQQNPWFTMRERRLNLLKAINTLSRRRDDVSTTALRMFERRTK